MRRRIILVAATLLLVGCGPTAAGKKLAADQMKDPASVMFRNVGSREGIVCGEINGKNAFGAYVGFQRFISDPHTGEALLDPERDAPIAIGSGLEVEIAQLHQQTLVSKFKTQWLSRCPIPRTSPQQDHEALLRTTEELQQHLEESKKYGASAPQ